MLGAITFFILHATARMIKILMIPVFAVSPAVRKYESPEGSYEIRDTKFAMRNSEYEIRDTKFEIRKASTR